MINYGNGHYIQVMDCTTGELYNWVLIQPRPTTASSRPRIARGYARGLAAIIIVYGAGLAGSASAGEAECWAVKTRLVNSSSDRFLGVWEN